MRLHDMVCDDPVLEDLRRRLSGVYDSTPCEMEDESMCSEDYRKTCPLRKAPDCPRVLRKTTQDDLDRRMHERLEREMADAKRSRIPERLHNLLGIGCIARIDETQPTIEAVRRHYRGVLVLYGPPGTGKTVAAAWWCWRQCGLFYRAEELCSLDWFDTGCVNHITDARALVIDDLGVEYGDSKGAWRAKMDAVINRRYDADTPTVITTNLPLDEPKLPADFRRLVGERAWRRIHECGAVYLCADVF